MAGNSAIVPLWYGITGGSVSDLASARFDAYNWLEVWVRISGYNSSAIAQLRFNGDTGTTAYASSVMDNNGAPVTHHWRWRVGDHKPDHTNHAQRRRRHPPDRYRYGDLGLSGGPMKTMTFTFDPAAVPAGAVIRVYHKDNSEFVGETVSDGSGTVAVTVDDEWLTEMSVRVLLPDGPGENDPTPLSVVIT